MADRLIRESDVIKYFNTVICTDEYMQCRFKEAFDFILSKCPTAYDLETVITAGRAESRCTKCVLDGCTLTHCNDTFTTADVYNQSKADEKERILIELKKEKIICLRFDHEFDEYIKGIDKAIEIVEGAR